MKIIAIYEHEILGRAYLWGNENMQYRLGTVATNYMTFDGYLLEDVQPRVEARGFKWIPLDWKE